MNGQELVRRRLVSCAEYHRMAEAGIFDEDDRVELIEGEIFEMAPIGSQHSSRTTRLSNVFARALGERAIIHVQGPIGLGDMSEPEPDIVVVDPAWNFNPDVHPAASEVMLIVEVADSSLRHDRDRKIPLYARFGIPEVWLIDVQGRELTVYRQPRDGGYASVQRLRGGSLSPAAFPDVAIELEKLL